ncbi:MAG: thioredoxin family protein [Akkermansia sp.]|nr:thioredoxin family protein [Akkermansia sp.]
MVHMVGMHHFRTILYAAGLCALISPAFSSEWITDFEEAKARAQAENKAIFTNFTGSDWCGYCMRMKQQVLDTPEFQAYVRDKFVLLEIDLPRRKQLEETVREERRNLCRRYEVTGFPTFVSMSHTGEVLGGWVGARPDVASTTALMDTALARGKQLAAARQLQGPARAQALMEVYQTFPKNFKHAAAALRKEIHDHDPADTTGLTDQARADAQMIELREQLNAHYRDYQRQTEIFDSFIAQAHPRNMERMMELKRDMVVFPCLNIMLLNADSVEEVLKARDYELKEAQNSYPDHMKADMIKALEANFQNPEALLQQVRARRARR